MSKMLEEAAIQFLKKCGYRCHYQKSKSSNFTIPGGIPRHIAIALGRQNEMTVYVNKTSVSNSPYPGNGIQRIDIAERYEKGHTGKNGWRGISESVARENPSLNPAKNDVFRLHVPDIASFEALISWYSGQDGFSVPVPDQPASENGHDQKVQPVSQEEFLLRQERKSQIGEAGELCVIQEELHRLRDECGCVNPENHVHRVSVDDVGRGYDIESTYPGHERCIEVKTTTTDRLDFFLTKNERRVLGNLGSRGWIYFVKLDSQTSLGKIEIQLQDPTATLPEQAFTPVVWKVDLSSAI